MQVFIDLPDEVLYRVLRYVAQPTDTVVVLCHQIAPLCTSTHKSVYNFRDHVWSMILYEEYRVCSKSITRPNIDASTDINEVKNAHEPIKYVNKLIKCLPRIYKDEVRKYKKVLIANKKCSSTILIKCIYRQLIDSSALVDLNWLIDYVVYHCESLPNFAYGSFEGKGGVTPLCVASAFGHNYMVKDLRRMRRIVTSTNARNRVIDELLNFGACPFIVSTSQFYSSNNKCVSGTFTPLQFIRKLKEIEVDPVRKAHFAVIINMLRNAEENVKRLKILKNKEK